MKRFTCETLEVEKADDKVQLTTFKAGLRSRDLVASLAKNPPRTMAEMLLKAQKYMNAEDAVAAIRDDEKPGDKGRKDNERREQKRECPDRRTTDTNRRKDDKNTRMVKFTPLVMLVDKILSRLRMSTISNGRGPFIRHPTFVIRINIAVSTRIMAITRKIFGT